MASQNHIVCYKQEKNVILGTSEILIKFKFKNINQMRPGMLRFFYNFQAFAEFNYTLHYASEEWRTASNASKIKPRQLDFKDKISIRSPLIVVLLVSRSYFHCVEVKPSQFNLEEKETLIMY